MVAILENTWKLKFEEPEQKIWVLELEIQTSKRGTQVRS